MLEDKKSRKASDQLTSALLRRGDTHREEGLGSGERKRAELTMRTETQRLLNSKTGRARTHVPVDEKKGKPQQVRPPGGGGPLGTCRDSSPRGSSLNMPHCADSGTTYILYLILELNFKSLLKWHIE